MTVIVSSIVLDSCSGREVPCSTYVKRGLDDIARLSYSPTNEHAPKQSGTTTNPPLKIPHTRIIAQSGIIEPTLLQKSYLTSLSLSYV